MCMCSFCGDRKADALTIGGLRLCNVCHSELCAVRPADPRYIWFQRAVIKAMAGAASAQNAQSL